MLLSPYSYLWPPILCSSSRRLHVGRQERVWIAEEGNTSFEEAICEAKVRTRHITFFSSLGVLLLLNILLPRAASTDMRRHYIYVLHCPNSLDTQPSIKNCLMIFVKFSVAMHVTLQTIRAVHRRVIHHRGRSRC